MSPAKPERRASSEVGIGGKNRIIPSKPGDLAVAKSHSRGMRKFVRVTPLKTPSLIFGGYRPPQPSPSGATSRGSSSGSAMTKKVDPQKAAARALRRRAAERLMRIEEMRDAATLADLGKTQREIAEVMKTTQPRVGRMLHAMKGRDPSVRTPEEIILLATANRLPRVELLRELTSIDYTYGDRAPEPFDGKTSGSWDEVVDAYADGLLSKKEFAIVRDAAQQRR